MKKILVVEDEYYARKSIVKILQESDLDIQVCGEAENGMKAIELLEEYKDIALVITDIQMQKMGGLELASYLHKHMGLSFYTGFIGPYILEKGYTQSTIGVINSISALSEVPVLFYINRMLRKHGTIKILFLSCFLMGIRILLPIRSGIIGIVLAQLLQGVTYMTMYYSCAVYISTCVYEKYQTKGQSILNVVQLGLGAIVGNLVGGKLIRLLGYEKGYLLMAGITTLMTICALIVYFWKNREQRNGGDVCEI